MMYRQRIYDQYGKAAYHSQVPRTVKDLEPRRAYCERLIRDHFPTNRQASILDLGCGHGAILYFAKQHGYQSLAGVDRSPDQVAAATRLGVSEVEEGDLLEFIQKIPEASEDLIITFD